MQSSWIFGLSLQNISSLICHCIFENLPLHTIVNQFLTVKLWLSSGKTNLPLFFPILLPLPISLRVSLSFLNSLSSPNPTQDQAAHRGRLDHWRSTPRLLHCLVLPSAEAGVGMGEEAVDGGRAGVGVARGRGGSYFSLDLFLLLRVLFAITHYSTY